MKFSSQEVENILKLYPFAKKKSQQVYSTNTDYVDFHSFYDSIIYLVETWLSILEPDEKAIIIDKSFKNKSFETIAIQSYYANHSSVIRKYRKILQKISSFNIK